MNKLEIRSVWRIETLLKEIDDVLTKEVAFTAPIDKARQKIAEAMSWCDAMGDRQ